MSERDAKREEEWGEWLTAGCRCMVCVHVCVVYAHVCACVCVFYSVLFLFLSCSGVGGLVVNEKEQVLAVQERFTTGGKRHWKLPGGHVDMG